MALVGFNMPQQAPRKESTLEKIALATDIASKVLGTAFQIPETLQKRREGKLQEAKLRTELSQTTEAAKEGEEGAFDIPGLGRRKAKPPARDFASMIQEKKALEMAPLSDNIDLFKHVHKAAPEIAAIPGVSIAEARERLLQKAVQDPRLELTLRQMDLSLANFKRGVEKEGREEFYKRFDEVKGRVNKIKDADIGGIELADRAKEMINRGSKIGASTAAAVVAKSVGKDTGALTESDIERYLPSNLQSYVTEIFNWVTGRAGATLSGPVKAALLDVVTEADRSMRKNLAFKIHDELSQLGAGEPEFFSRPEIKEYQKSIGRQIKGMEKAALVRQLEDQIEANPGRAQEIQLKINGILETF